MQVTTVSAKALDQIDRNLSIILDVRTGIEHAEKQLKYDHYHVPLDELNPSQFMAEHGFDQTKKVYILCRTGSRAAKAAQKFATAGYPNVNVVEGGMIACEECGHEMKGYGAGRGATGVNVKGPISLERQVRIVAGLLVAIGAALGLLVSPLFALIPLIVGSGLVFSGVTDRCGMALLLAKAPWNKLK